jgi:hypothetical protein
MRGLSVLVSGHDQQRAVGGVDCWNEFSPDITERPRYSDRFVIPAAVGARSTEAWKVAIDARSRDELHHRAPNLAFQDGEWIIKGNTCD